MRRPRPAPIVAGAVVAGAAAVCYERVVRPWQQGWGATGPERAAVLPGDEEVAEPAVQVTRATTIDAEPEAVWPWIVQIGADRGGFYSYDWLENLFGLGVHSATGIVPEWQRLQVGDLVRANRAGSGGWYVVALRPTEVLALKLADTKQGLPARRDRGVGWEFLWTFAVHREGPGRTRLVVRERVAFGRRASRWVMAPLGLVSFVMTRKMLLGIKERAERSEGSGRSERPGQSERSGPSGEGSRPPSPGPPNGGHDAERRM